MIITKTPFRMSFFGGGTDMPDFFMENNGAILSATFNKYCYVTLRHLPRFFNYTSEIVYSRIERVNSTGEIEHPLVRNIMRFLKMHELRINYEADLPARSGLGTSSSFAVGLLNACYALKGKYVDKKRLADEAIYVERTLCNEAGGWQDQIAVSFGGFNRINFSADGYDVAPLILSHDVKNDLNRKLMLFFTGFTRLSSEVQKEGFPNSADKTARLKEMYSLVGEAEKILVSGHSLDDFGRLLDYTWSLKRGISSVVSTNFIDRLYQTGRDAGALGGKLLGAGGGGFLVFYVPEENQGNVLKAMENLLYVPFEFESGGTKTIYYDTEHYDSETRVEDN